MTDFLKQNGGTIIVGVVLLAAIILIVIKMRKDKKKGKSCSCGCCSGCFNVDSCHKNSKQ